MRKPPAAQPPAEAPAAEGPAAEGPTAETRAPETRAGPPPAGRPAQRRLVLDAIAAGRAASRAEIARRFGLRPTSVSRLVGDLLRAGLLVEASGRAHGRGRPASLLVANPKALTVLVFQVVSQALRATVTDLSGRPLATEALEVPGDCDAAGMEDAFERLLTRGLAAHPHGSELTGLAFALPGVLDVAGMRWLFSSRWPALRDFDLRRVGRGIDPGRVGRGTELPRGAPGAGLPRVVRRNLDAELQARLARQADWPGGTLLLHWGYGIGAAYGIDGTVVNMGEGRFGEIGHWRLNRARGRTCRCGRDGCLETLAALWALHPALAASGRAVPLNEAAFAERAGMVDLLAVPAMREALDAVVTGLANLCRTLFPRRIIVSGPFVANPAVWSAFNDRFAAEGVMIGVPLPALMVDQRSEDLERESAGRPLLEAALAARLGA